MCEGYNEGPFSRPAVLRRCVPDDSGGECHDGYRNRAAGHLEQTQASRWHPYRLLQPILFHVSSTFHSLIIPLHFTLYFPLEFLNLNLVLHSVVTTVQCAAYTALV